MLWVKWVSRGYLVTVCSLHETRFWNCFREIQSQYCLRIKYSNIRISLFLSSSPCDFYYAYAYSICSGLKRPLDEFHRFVSRSKTVLETYNILTQPQGSDILLRPVQHTPRRWVKHIHVNYTLIVINYLLLSHTCVWGRSLGIRCASLDSLISVVNF